MNFYYDYSAITTAQSTEAPSTFILYVPNGMEAIRVGNLYFSITNFTRKLDCKKYIHFDGNYKGFLLFEDLPKKL